MRADAAVLRARAVSAARTSVREPDGRGCGRGARGSARRSANRASGVGARAYSFRDPDVDSETDFAGYFSGGANLEYGNLAFGVRVRDHVTAFDGMGIEAGSETRNDLSAFDSGGLRF